MTLGARLSRRDEASFVGRGRELEFLEGLFAAEPTANVVLVHGPGGIGKSTLLREVRRRGAAAGWTPVVVEARDLAPVPDALAEALAPAQELERPLVLIDSYERMAALGGYLRRGLLPELPDSTIVVIAGRRPPEQGWAEGGWESLTAELELEPLTDAESALLLEAHGVADPARAGEITGWANGSPLALTLAAGADPDWSPLKEGERRELMRALIRRLADSELDATHRDVVAVASIARVTTVELLRDVLPDVDAVEALEWLRTRTFTEPLGDGVTLHDLVRRSARADLHGREPERERELRRRIADHLYGRATSGDSLVTIDLSELVESREIRAFYSWSGTGRTRIDEIRAGDEEQVALMLASKGGGEWWGHTRKLFREARERVVIARDQGDNVCGYSISVTPENAPAAAVNDVLLGPWLAHAREHAPDGNAILWRDAVDFTDDPGSGIQATLNMVGVLRSGLPNPRLAYLPIDPRLQRAIDFSAALGARHVPELDVTVGQRDVQCHVLDYGPGGLIGMQRAVVYMELGLTPPAADEPAPTRAQRSPEIDPGMVRDALRSMRVPSDLASCPLAVGEGVDERAESVRGLLAGAAERAFGNDENERLLQRVLVRGYLDPAPSHEAAADELNLSRAAYFRRLKLASERLAEYLAAESAR
jgi:hypothetical protein